ncbi:hypothetical protein NSTC731_04481 [Nostoc sp. DSM 114167]|jgi:hypothetical protein
MSKSVRIQYFQFQTKYLIVTDKKQIQAYGGIPAFLTSLRCREARERCRGKRTCTRTVFCSPVQGFERCGEKSGYCLCQQGLRAAKR